MVYPVYFGKERRDLGGSIAAHVGLPVALASEGEVTFRHGGIFLLKSLGPDGSIRRVLLRKSGDCLLDSAGNIAFILSPPKINENLKPGQIPTDQDLFTSMFGKIALVTNQTATNTNDFEVNSDGLWKSLAQSDGYHWTYLNFVLPNVIIFSLFGILSFLITYLVRWRERRLEEERVLRKMIAEGVAEEAVENFANEFKLSNKTRERLKRNAIQEILNDPGARG